MQEQILKNLALAKKQKPLSSKVFRFDVIKLPPVSADKITVEKLANGQTVYHCEVCLD